VYEATYPNQRFISRRNGRPLKSRSPSIWPDVLRHARTSNRVLCITPSPNQRFCFLHNSNASRATRQALDQSVAYTCTETEQRAVHALPAPEGPISAHICPGVIDPVTSCATTKA
jgi:hypothetical protein